MGNEKPWAFGALLFLTVCAFVVGVWGRLWNLAFPPTRIWDEIYFPVMARKYLSGTEFFDLHPPLGKFIIATSIAVFGDTSFAWRLMPAVFGCALVVLVGVLGWHLFGDRVGALLLVVLFAGETILIVHSRTGVMDGILVFFVLATFLVALRTETPSRTIWPAVMLGLTLSVKWAVFPVAAPMAYVLWRRGLLRYFLANLWVSAVIYLAFVYVERLIIITPNPIEAWVNVWSWHLEAFDKVTAAIPNAWGSPWWSWPVMLRPIRYFYGANAEGQLQVIWAIGNPVVWWSSTLAVLAGLVEVARRAIGRKLSTEDPLVPIMLGYALLLLPWIPGTRIPYIYNYLPIYAFALLALGYWLWRIWHGPGWGPWLVVAFAACALAGTLFFMPAAIGLPLDQEDLMRRIWLDSWFYREAPVPGSGCVPPASHPGCG